MDLSPEGLRPKTMQQRPQLPTMRNLPSIEEGGDQNIVDRTLPEGSENMLNTKQSIYYSFYSRLYEAIGPIWQSRAREVPYRRQLSPGDYVTIVDIVLDRDGNLVETRYLQSAGVADFDDAVESSWRKIGRFPNPPRGLLNAEGKLHIVWSFTFQIDNRVPDTIPAAATYLLTVSGNTLKRTKTANAAITSATSRRLTKIPRLPTKVLSDRFMSLRAPATAPAKALTRPMS